jgi:hypothetical protein
MKTQEGSQNRRGCRGGRSLQLTLAFEGGRMKRFLLVLFALALMVAAPSARAQLLYSFESTDAAGPTDGFANNGGGITVSQDTIGATVGTNSMKNVTVAGATFTGALTSNVPAPLNDPSIGSINVDLTIPSGGQFAGAFADIGITIFGAEFPPSGETFGNQFQVDPSSERNVAVAPGTTTLNIPLIGTDPATFNLHQTYAQVLANGFIPTGFEFFYSKSNDAPLTVYLDNVTAVAVPEPTTLGLIGVGSVLLMRRRRAA